MPDSALRLLRLLGLLQGRPTWSGTELAERLGVEPRSIRRDIERLRSLGYQVDGTPGASGGYRLRGGDDVPPMMFEDDEAVAIAVVLGVSAGAAVPGIERGALTALAKLDRLLPPRLRAPLSSLRSATVSLVAPTEAVSTENLILLAQACDSHQLATFAYRARDGRRTDRRVEPHRLVATDQRWYLVAHDLDRHDWRTFRLDRASSVRLSGHTFVPRKLDDPAAMVAESIAIAPYDHRAVVRVEGPAETMDRMIPPLAGVTEPGDGFCTVRMGADDFDWVAGYLVGLGVNFEVVEPIELREHMATIGARLVRAHRPPGG